MASLGKVVHPEGRPITDNRQRRAPRAYSNLENTAAPYSITRSYHGRRVNSASMISFDRVRSSMKVESICAPSVGSRSTRFDSLLNASDRLSKFIEPIEPHSPSTMNVLACIIVG